MHWNSRDRAWIYMFSIRINNVVVLIFVTCAAFASNHNVNEWLRMWPNKLCTNCWTKPDSVSCYRMPSRRFKMRSQIHQSFHWKSIEKMWLHCVRDNELESIESMAFWRRFNSTWKEIQVYSRSNCSNWQSIKLSGWNNYEKWSSMRTECAVRITKQGEFTFAIWIMKLKMNESEI